MAGGNHLFAGGGGRRFSISPKFAAAAVPDGKDAAKSISNRLSWRAPPNR